MGEAKEGMHHALMMPTPVGMPEGDPHLQRPLYTLVVHAYHRSQALRVPPLLPSLCHFKSSVLLSAFIGKTVTIVLERWQLCFSSPPFSPFPEAAVHTPQGLR